MPVRRFHSTTLRLRRGLVGIPTDRIAVGRVRHGVRKCIPLLPKKKEKKELTIDSLNSYR